MSLKKDVLILRKKGWSYGKISKILSVPKSTVAFWIKNPITPNKYILTPARLLSIQKGWKTCKRRRIESEEHIKKYALEEVKMKKFTLDSLWLMGTMLYWAEGAKQKEYRISQRVSFSNQDPFMIQIFILWLIKCLKVKKEMITFDIYIHENYKNKLKQVKLYWAKVTGFSENKFDKIYFKKHQIKSKRRNVGDHYFGLIRVQVLKSTNLNRKISGWIKGICQVWGVVKWYHNGLWIHFSRFDS